MMNLRNSVTLIGNLGRDPEFVEMDNGKRLAKISLATSETYRNQKGERVTATQWHQCVAWGKLADTMRSLLSKGRQVAVHGKITYTTYQDKSGATRYSTQIVVSDFVLLGQREQGESSP